MFCKFHYLFWAVRGNLCHSEKLLNLHHFIKTPQSFCNETRSYFSLLPFTAGVVCSTMAVLPLNRNLSCLDKVPLTGSSGFSSSRAVPGLPWGISSMPPIETPRATQPIPYSNDATHCALIGCKEAEVSFAKVQDRAAWAQCGVLRWGWGALGVGIIRLLGAMVIMALLRAREHRESTLIEI